MKILQSPAILSDYSKFKRKIFLAGGISNCPNWQEDMVENFKIYKEKSTIIFNPRRKGDLAKDTDEAKKQIIWEHIHLQESTDILFWFPEETVCPITLFELGKYLMYTHKNIYVGIHPNYSRKFDLEVQIPLVRPQCKIVYSLEDLIIQVMKGTN